MMIDELIDFLEARARIHFPEQAESGNYERLVSRRRRDARQRSNGGQGNNSSSRGRARRSILTCSAQCFI